MIEQNALQKPNYIVGIGASAGGLEALETFFDYMQPDTGLAFVIVQHLSPDFKSMMNELLKRHTKMKIERVEHKILVRPNTIYLIPASKDMILSGNKLLLIERNPDRNLNFPIDIFFQSLAKEAKERAIAVILSGTGSDGSRGVVDIHKEGGFVLVQDKKSAQFDGMPHNTIETGIADIITEPRHMPDEILTYIANLNSHIQSSSDLPASPAPANELETIFSLLEERFQVDFKKYKPNTILRRIERRITLAGSRDIKSYLIRLKNTPTELDTLYRDLLIEVTQFFRNPEAFSALKEIVIPELVELAISGGEIRVWVPGCATGEEAYSLAILFDEYLEEHHIQLTRNFFATDVHQQSLRTAARGFYKGNSLTNLLPEQLARHFTPYQDGYMIDKKFREMVTFARHNVLENPPFTKQHLISCRNVLIYLEHAVQQQVLTHFHFGLVTGGFLLLGASDHIGRLGKEFDSLGRWRIFRKKRDVRLDDMKLPPPTPPKPLQTQPSLLGQLAPRLSDEWVESLLDEYVPDGLLLNEGYDVLYILGNGNEYLQPQKGPGTLNALKMLEGDLQITIRGGLIHVIKKNEVVTYKNIEAITQKGRVKVNVTIRPLKSSFHRINRFFVALEKVQIDQPEPSEKPVINPASSAQIISLRQELDYTKEHLKLTIEEVETTNEELQSTNEELTASNEEMQSTNEELQSVNEELYTVNAEHQRKIDELIQLTDDLQNLQRSTQIGVIFLDADLRIRSFTPVMAESFNLLPQDIGRPLEHLAYNIDLSFDDLTQAAQLVLNNGKALEFETKLRDGSYYLMRVLPYQTESGHIDGLVLTFIDIAARKELEALEVIRQSQQYLDVMSGLLVVLDSNGEITRINPKGAELLGYTEDELIGCNWFNTCLPPSNIDEVKSVFKRLMAGEEAPLASYENEVITKSGELRTIAWNNVILKDINGNITGTISSGVDITERKEAETALQQTTHQLQVITDNIPGRISYVDCEQRIQFANQRYELLTGLTHEQLIGRHVRDIVGLERYEWAKPYIEQVLLGESVSFEAEGPTVPDATFEHELVTLVPDMHNETVQGYFALIVDITDRIRAEQALQNTSRQLRTITDNIPAWIARLGPDYHFRFVNKQYNRLTNLSLVEIIGRPIWEILGSEFFERSRPSMERVLDGDTVTFEGEIPNIESMDPYTVQVTCLPDVTNDSIRGIFVLAVDVTPLKQNARFIETITETDPNWIYVYSLNQQRNIYFNRDIGVELGYSAAETQAMGDTLLATLMHPDDWAKQPAHWFKLIADQNGQVFRNEYRLRHKNGEWRWHVSYETVFKRNDDGSVAEIIGSAIDITNRKKAEQTVEKATHQLQLVMDNVPARVAYIDAEQRIRFANRQYEPLNLLPRDQTLGQPLQDVLGEERYAQEKPYIDRVLAGETVRFEIDIPSLTAGQSEHELVTFVPEVVDGEVQGFFSLVIDITDLSLTKTK